MEWYRAYHGMPHDPKLQVIAKRTGQPMAVVVAVWVCVLDAASQHEPRGVIEIDPEEIAVIQGIEFEDAVAIIQAFHDKKMLDENNHLTAWDKRQHTSSTERSRKSRATQKKAATKGSTTQQRAASSSTAQRKNRKKMTDTEQIHSRTDSETDPDADSKKETKQKKNRGRAEKEECEKEKPEICGKDSKQILQQMLDIWNAEVQSKLSHGQKAILTPKRKELLTCRWIEDFAEDIRAWKYYCEIISNSDFCLGKLDGKDWTIDLTWAIESSEHVAKILEGGFSGGKHPSPPPACHDPLLQTGWDHVLACFSDKHGKATCKSWLSGTEVQGIQSSDDGLFVIIACRNSFLQQWLQQHYQADLNLWWTEHTHHSRRITGVLLTIKEKKS